MKPQILRDLRFLFSLLEAEVPPYRFGVIGLWGYRVKGQNVLVLWRLFGLLMRKNRAIGANVGYRRKRGALDGVSWV